MIILIMSYSAFYLALYCIQMSSFVPPTVQNTKDMHFDIIYIKEKKQIFTFKKLEPMNF